MKSMTLVCLLIFQLAVCKAQPAGKAKLIKASLEQQVDGLVHQYQALDIFSGVVLIAEHGKPVYQKAFGLADRENKVPNTLATLFDIGSMNKTFTSIVIRQLAAEGKLKLSDKLIKYVPGFKDPNVSKVTIEHLLMHSSGFGDYHGPEYFASQKNERDIAAITEIAKNTELMFEPGTEDSYSNLGYVLLGAVIEKVSGKSYFDNVRTRIVEPLKLKNTYLENLDRFNDRRAIGYLKTPFGELESNEEFSDTPNPDGGFLATAEDIMRFYRSYYYDDVLISEKMKADDEFFKWIKSLPPGKAPSHAGGFPGANTAMFQVVSDDISIIVFANMDEPVAEQLATGILKIVRNEKPDEPKLPAVQNVRIAFEKHGAEYVKQNFEELTTNFHPTDPRDLILNNLGYAYLFGKKNVDKAIEIFTLNTDLFPESANVWDSLGEAWRVKGDKSKALKYYQKALSIDPRMPSARQAVAELGSEDK